MDSETGAARRHGRLRVHGRRALPGVAHREPRVRPAGAGPDGGRRRARRRTRWRRPPSRLGWDESTTDWRELVARDDIDLIDICTPGDSHAEIAHRRAGRRQARAVREAAGQHGRRGARRWPPRPAAARALGVRSMCGFNYRRVPAVALHAAARRGRAGSARSATSARCTCRTGSSTRSSRWSGGCNGTRAGSGALGDIGAHIIDLTQYVTGQRITGVSALTETFVKRAAAAGRVHRAGGVAAGAGGGRPAR